jgi:hypothetical protein
VRVGSCGGMRSRTRRFEFWQVDAWGCGKHALVMQDTFFRRRGCVLSKDSAPCERVDVNMYSRTQNDNGTYNTRCLDCMMTVASSIERDDELERIELHHMCPERALAQLLANESAMAAHAQRN